MHTYPQPNSSLTGSLVGLAPVVKPMFKPDEWFTFEVWAEGNRLVIKVNSAVVTDFVDQKNTHSKGHIALQAMSDKAFKAPTVVQFRKIEIKELPSTKAGQGK